MTIMLLGDPDRALRGSKMTDDSPLLDRRQRAVEAALDLYRRYTGPEESRMIREAVDVATRVKITDDIVAAHGAGLAEAFRAAGLEVVE